MQRLPTSRASLDAACLRLACCAAKTRFCASSSAASASDSSCSRAAQAALSLSSFLAISRLVFSSCFALSTCNVAESRGPSQSVSMMLPREHY